MIKRTKEAIKDILSIVDRANLQELDINEDNFEELCDNCYGNGVIKFDSGVSKGVLFLENYPDIVIKIPFTSCSDYDRSYSYRQIEEDGETGWTREYLDGHFDSAWQSLPDYLQDKLERHWDYCEVETLLFADAIDEGVSGFFAETVFIGFSHDHPVYVQEKARIYGGQSEYNGYELLFIRNGMETIKKEMVAYDNSLNVDDSLFAAPSEWIIDFYLYYGAEELIHLYRFITETGIEDLHFDNVGYINHRPVITDYASFNS